MCTNNASFKYQFYVYAYEKFSPINNYVKTNAKNKLVKVPSDFLSIISKILSTPLVTPHKSPILFECTEAAKFHNAALLAKHNYNLSALIDDHPNTEISYGSEFRPPEVLAPLLNRRHNWDRIRCFLSGGFSAKFKPISDEQRIKDNESVLTRGNHKSAMEHIEMPRENAIKEIGLGFQFAFDKSIINKIPDAVATPYGAACQSTINDLIELVIKYRPTHDLSNEESPKNSANDRLERDDLPELFYGWCLSRLLHHIHALR